MTEEKSNYQKKTKKLCAFYCSTMNQRVWWNFNRHL